MPKPSPAEQHSSLLFSYTDTDKCIFESLISAIWGYIISELSVLFLSELPMNKVLPFLRKTGELSPYPEARETCHCQRRKCWALLMEF